MSSIEGSAPAAPSTATYTGSCHCQRVKYTVAQSPPLTDPSFAAVECNCSICTRNGYLLIYVPDKNISFEKGSMDEFTKYTFAPKNRIAHHFCPGCGTSCFAKSQDPQYFPDFTAINVRTFEGVDVKELKLTPVDGKSS